jgi:membrane protease YdiL (CAAX protease family)
MSSSEEKCVGKGRVLGVLCWTLIPSLAIWLGLYQFKSALITFVLYHGVCLTPAIIWGRNLWGPTWNKPSWRELALLISTGTVFCVVTVILYELIGTKCLSNENALNLINRYAASNWYLLVFLSAFIFFVNPFLEEIFWRGVVLNELDTWHTRPKHFGLVWSSCSYALFHYLIFRLVLFPGFAEIGIVMLAFFGASLAILYRKTGSIVTTAIAHGLLTDLAVVALIVDLLCHHPNFIR